MCKTYFNNTLCSPATGSVRVETRVETVLIDTGLVHRTIIVSPALWSVTLSVRVSTISLGTRADRVVSTCETRGLWCTGVADNARVNTSLIDACFGLRTVRVLCTLWSRCN